jgi:orotidine-5'-phosphate decarboxylase
MTAYAERLARVTAERGASCVGIDPHPALLAAWGLDATPAGVERFARTVIEALASRVAVFKPQSAFFEVYGSKGVAVLERVLTDIRATGALSILDAKRGDIGSTMAAYADAYLASDAPLAADAVTLSPFLGFESLRPALDLAERAGRGVYVLARTSNPEGAEVQLARTPGLTNGNAQPAPTPGSANRNARSTRAASSEGGSGAGTRAVGSTVAQSIVDAAAQANAAFGGQVVGLVVGATHTDVGIDLAGFDGSLLVPGIGAQGGSVDSLPAVFGNAWPQVLPMVGRGVLQAGPDPEAMRAALDALLGTS